MKKAVFGVIAATALAAMVTIPSAAQAKKHHRHVVVQSNGITPGVSLSWDECSQRAIKLGLGFGQSGNGDYMRECTTGRPSGGRRQRNG
jgi:hypothetical protein